MQEQDRGANKAPLRARMLEWRRGLDRVSRAQWSAQMCEALLNSELYANAHVIVGYRAFDGEADPEAVLQQARRHGKSLGLPRIEGTTLRLHHYWGEPLQTNRWGVQEPLPSAAPMDPAEVDLVLVPAVAVDGQGGRLGYGKGYYDRLLPEMVRAARVGFVYAEQCVAELPVEPHDVALQRIVTPGGLRVVGP